MPGSECPSNAIARWLPESPHFSAGEVQEIHKALAEADAGDFAAAEEIEALNTKYKL
jgi:predicted transcriptional regulator